MSLAQTAFANRTAAVTVDADKANVSTLFKAIAEAGDPLKKVHP